MLNEQSRSAETALQEASLPVRIYYEDTDAAGVVYYASYLRFCERGRTEWLRRHGFAQHELLTQQQLAFVVRRVEADYRRPAHLDDILEVRTSVSQLGRASVVFTQRVLRETELVFDARISIACIHVHSGRPTPIPNAISSILNESLPS